MRGFLILLSLLFPMFASAAPHHYEAGQQWSYTVRPGDEGSLLTVLKVETDKAHGEVVMVRVDGLHIRQADGGTVGYIGFMPLAKSAIDASVVEQVKSGQKVPDFARGYEAWKAAGAPALEIPLRDVVIGVAMQAAAPQ